jgi:hypothetical protein
MSATYPTRVLLAFRSGGVCAFPGCGKQLTYEATHGTDTYTGEAAHIRGEKPTAARYDPAMTDAQRDAVDNLLYMCGDHHTIIDKVEEDWPVDKLTVLKMEHEAKVRVLMEEGFASVAFPELVSAVSRVSGEAPSPASPDFTLVPPEEKIQRNELSNGPRHIIAAGLASRGTVAQFVEAEAQLDPEFPERLKAGFLAEYYSLRSEGEKGDVLFEMMCAFAQRGAKTQAERTAGIAVLVYFFEICDVFEK